MIRENIELWGGFECSLTRIGENFYDQLERTGHASNADDLDLLCESRIRTVRYPVLWEKVAPHGLHGADWTWTDERLSRLKDLDIRPIAGLVHHGSGPRSTNLLDDSFASGLAEFAGAVARRYPWIDAYTPINEPITTARFSTLYGHWYPHHSSPKSFVRAVLNQVRGTVLAMRAIRVINPDAELITTEDFSVVSSTPLLAYQAEFENARRWLGTDLLCGKVTEQHPLYEYLVANGAAASELASFVDASCVPAVVGLNYYVTSERFLDERLSEYPEHTHGKNERHRYADVEAVRVNAGGITTHCDMLIEAHARYSLPVAVTEVHLGCTREEQMRWFAEAWTGAAKAAEKGADVKAVTLWALAGSADWDSLMAVTGRTYECGLIDARKTRRDYTGVAKLARPASEGRRLNHPVLSVPGWWRRDERLMYGLPNKKGSAQPESQPANPILITGATGTLGRAFARICESRAIPYLLLNRADCDIAVESSVTSAISRIRPWAVINTAGYVRVEDAAREREKCFRENTTGPAILAKVCGDAGIKLVAFSSDLVFDGRNRLPYLESDAVNPQCVYGESKALAERHLLELNPDALTIRTSAFFGPWDEFNFLAWLLREFAKHSEVNIDKPGVVSPTFVPDLVHTCLDLLLDDASGIWHLTNDGSVSWAELGRRAAQRCGLPRQSVVSPASMPLINTSLGSERGSLMPTLDAALDRYFAAPEVQALSIAIGESRREKRREIQSISKDEFETLQVLVA